MFSIEAQEIQGPLNERSLVWVKAWDGFETITVLANRLRGQGEVWGGTRYVVTVLAPVRAVLPVQGPVEEGQVLAALTSSAGTERLKATRAIGVTRAVNYALEVLGD